MKDWPIRTRSQSRDLGEALFVVSLAVVGVVATLVFPTVALFCGIAATVLGALKARGGSGLERAAGVFGLVLGIASIVAVLALILFGSGAHSGSLSTSAPPP